MTNIINPIQHSCMIFQKKTKRSKTGFWVPKKGTIIKVREHIQPHGLFLIVSDSLVEINHIKTKRGKLVSSKEYWVELFSFDENKLHTFRASWFSSALYAWREA